jgi:hypothetical protein
MTPRGPPTEPPEAPAGVHPRWHATHLRVVERLRQLDAPESDDPRVPEQVLREEA